MKYASVIARVLLGLVFTVFGLNAFLHFLPTPGMPGLAGQFMGALLGSHYYVIAFGTELIGGVLLLSLTYILCLSACVAAFGGSVSIAKIGFVYLTGSAIGSIIPTPGGLGAVEAALTAGLTAAGVPSGVAVSAVLLFRLLTFWLPVPFGWVALNYLERRHDL